MYIFLSDLTRELRSVVQLQAYHISDSQAVSGIQMFPSNFDPAATKLKEDTAYVCEYRQLKQFDLQTELPPLICVVEQANDVDIAVAQSRSVILVYGSTVVDVLVLLTDAIYESASKASHVTELTRELLKCGSLSELMETGFQLLQNPLVVTDSTQKIIKATSESLISSMVYRKIVSSEYLPVGHPQLTQHPANLYADAQILDEGIPIAGLPAVVCEPLTIGGQTIGYLHVLACSREISQDDRQIIALLGNLLTVELHRHPETRHETPDQQYLRFFRDVLDNIAGEPEQIMTRMRELKLQMHQFLYVMVIYPKSMEFSAHINFYELTKTIAWMFPGCYSFLYKDSVFTILSSKEEIVDMNTFLLPLLPLLEKHELMAGVSHPFAVIHQLRPYGFQARKAIQFGSVMDPDKHIYLFSDYLLTYIAELCLKTNDVEPLCPPGLIRLIMSNQENKDELLDTLKVYLKCGRSKAQTAKELYVHVNTVKYRIAQIQEITKLNIGDDNVASHLMLAYKMIEYKHFFSTYQSMPL